MLQCACRHSRQQPNNTKGKSPMNPEDTEATTYLEISVENPPISKIYEWFTQGKLIVNRRYQRKLVWTLEDKQALVETISNRYPLQIFYWQPSKTDTKSLTACSESTLSSISSTSNSLLQADTCSTPTNGQQQNSTLAQPPAATQKQRTRQERAGKKAIYLQENK